MDLLSQVLNLIAIIAASDREMTNVFDVDDGGVVCVVKDLHRATMPC